MGVGRGGMQADPGSRVHWNEQRVVVVKGMLVTKV